MIAGRWDYVLVTVHADVYTPPDLSNEIREAHLHRTHSHGHFQGRFDGPGTVILRIDTYV